MAGEGRDGSSTPSPATDDKPTVPTREELRARWTCDCEATALVRPRTPGSHKAVGFMCPARRAVRMDERGAGDVVEVLVWSHQVPPAGEAEMPSNVLRLWRLAVKRWETAHVTWALCNIARRRPNPQWSAPAQDEQRSDAVAKTILVPSPWESWALRAPGLVGTWGGWSGDAVKPEQFYVLQDGKRHMVNVSEAAKYVRTGAWK